MASQFPCQTTGALLPGDPNYIKRAADEELLENAEAGEYSYVLAPRQIGKSSLLAASVDRLRQRKFCVATANIQSASGEKSESKWYEGVIEQLVATASENADFRMTFNWEKWWDRQRGPFSQRMVLLIRKAFLEATTARWVIAVDEIEATTNLLFSDNFFAAIRSCHDFRPGQPVFRRLSFVLLGVATPDSLIKNRTRTPFNVGRKVDLQYFTKKDVEKLAAGLPLDNFHNLVALNRIWDWTAGQPHLTLDACDALCRKWSNGSRPASSSETIEDVNALIQNRYLNRETRGANPHFDYIEQKRVGEFSEKAKLLRMYAVVLSRKGVTDRLESRIIGELKISGLARTDDKGRLCVANQIYEKTFDSAWVRDNTPTDWTKRTLNLMLGVVILLFGKLAFDFSTIQFEFEERLYSQQRIEIAITRKFNPFGYRLRTSIFLDEFRDTPSEKEFNDRVKLSSSSLTELKQIRDFFPEGRTTFSEIEWLDRPISNPTMLFSNENSDRFLLPLARAEPVVVEALSAIVHGSTENLILTFQEAEVSNYKSDDLLVELLQRVGRTFLWPGRSKQLTQVSEALRTLVVSDDVATRNRVGIILKAEQVDDPILIDAIVKEKVAYLRFKNALGIILPKMEDWYDFLFVLLDSSDARIRYLASRSLVRFSRKDPTLVARINLFLRERNDLIRFESAAVLAELGIGDIAVVDVLVSRLKDQESNIRSSAERPLVELGKSDVRVVNTFVSLLKDRDRFVRYSAAASLVRLGKSDQELIDTLVELTKDRENYKRFQGFEQLVELGNRKPSAIDALVSLLNDQDRDLRGFSAQALGQLAKVDEAVIVALVSLLKDEDSYVRYEAAASLGHLGKNDPIVVDALVSLINDEDSAARYSAAASLVLLGEGDQKIVDALASVINDQQSRVRFSAIESLGILGKRSPAASDILVSLLKNENSVVCYKAVESLLKLGNSNSPVVDALVRLLRDQDRGVRNNAASLVQFGKDSPTVITSLVSLLSDQNEVVRYQAAKSLGQTKTSDPVAINALVSLLEDQDKPMRYEVAKSLVTLGKREPTVVDALVSLIKDRDSGVRYEAAIFLGQSGLSDPVVVAVLVSLLEDEDDNVRLAGARSLAELGNSDPVVLDALVMLLKDNMNIVRDSAAGSLGKLGQKRSEWSNEQMLRDLCDPDSSVRARAGIVLAWRDDRLNWRTEERIRDLRKDERLWVRQAALDALYRIEERKFNRTSKAPVVKFPESIPSN